MTNIMKNKIINILLIIASVLSTSLAIAAAVLGCYHALILLIVPLASLTYFVTKIAIKSKLNKKIK